MWKGSCGSSWVIQRWGLESEDGLVFIQKHLVYWAWYSRSNSGVFKSAASTQEFSDAGYPFHLTKYCCLWLRPVFRSETISLISYSSLPSMISGGGCGYNCLYACVSTYRIRRSM